MLSLAVSVTSWTTDVRRRGRGHFAAVVVMLSLWASLCALEASPQLHALLHSDAQNPGHTCLITQLHQHTLLAGFAPSAVPVAPVAVGNLAAVEQSLFFASYDYRLSPSRAPPVSFLLPGV